VSGNNLLLEVLFSAWLAGTILVQIPKMRALLPGWVFVFCPQWNFFAPRPGQHSYYLLLRTVDSSGDVTAWRELVVVQRRPAIQQWLWNPGRRLNKAVVDIVAELAELIQINGPEGQIRLSFSYVFVVALASAFVTPNGVHAFQVCLLVRQALPSAPHVALLVSDELKCS
jgi:hypothetical protein